MFWVKMMLRWCPSLTNRHSRACGLQKEMDSLFVSLKFFAFGSVEKSFSSSWIVTSQQAGGGSRAAGPPDILGRDSNSPHGLLAAPVL